VYWLGIGLQYNHAVIATLSPNPQLGLGPCSSSIGNFYKKIVISSSVTTCGNWPFFQNRWVLYGALPTVSHGWQTQGTEALHDEGSLATDARRASLLHLDCSGSAARWCRVNTRGVHAWQFASLRTEHDHGPTTRLAGGLPEAAFGNGACLCATEFLSCGKPTSFAWMVKTIGASCCCSSTSTSTRSVWFRRIRGAGCHARSPSNGKLQTPCSRSFGNSSSNPGTNRIGFGRCLRLDGGPSADDITGC